MNGIVIFANVGLNITDNLIMLSHCSMHGEGKISVMISVIFLTHLRQTRGATLQQATIISVAEQHLELYFALLAMCDWWRSGGTVI